MRPLVLVAEPDPFALGLLEEACAAEGCEVMTAIDGSDALAAIAREAPSLVIAACELGGVSGAEILRLVRGEPELRPIAVLLAGEPESSDATTLGDADGWLARPYRVVEVQARVRDLLDSRLARRRRVRESETVRRVGNRAQWKIALEHEAQRAIRHRAPLGCVLVSSASAERDARTLAELLRVVDEVFVLDEERVGVLLPETPAGALCTVAARIRETLPRVRLVTAALPDDAPDPASLEACVTRRLSTA